MKIITLVVVVEYKKLTVHNCAFVTARKRVNERSEESFFRCVFEVEELVVRLIIYL